MVCMIVAVVRPTAFVLQPRGPLYRRYLRAQIFFSTRGLLLRQGMVIHIGFRTKKYGSKGWFFRYRTKCAYRTLFRGSGRSQGTLSCKEPDSRHFPASRTSRSVPSRSQRVPSPSRTHVPVPGLRFTSYRTAGQLTGQIGDFEPIFGDCPVSRKYDFSGEIRLVRIITRTLEYDSITIS